jgi:hypothetical protein
MGLDVGELAAQWAAAIALAERPAPFSSRDGSILRLVPFNERLSVSEMQQHLRQLLQQQEHMLTEFTEHLPLILSSSSSRGKGTDSSALTDSLQCMDASSELDHSLLCILLQFLGTWLPGPGAAATYMLAATAKP